MILLTEDDARPARDDYPRDRYGRVTLGDTVLYSPSSLPNYLGAGFSAPAWSARCQAKGAGLRPDLGVMAAPLDVNADKAELDRIVEEMENAGGRNAKANMGTAIHSAVRRMWRGETPEMPPECRDDIWSIAVTISQWGLELVDGWDERFVISHDLGTGGSCDAFVTSGAFEGVVVLDVKTGQLKPLDCAMQLAAYANGTHSWDGVNDPEPLPFEIRTDIGLVLHAPWGNADARIVVLDLVEGRRLAELAIAAHRETLDSGRVVIKDVPPSAPNTAAAPQIDPSGGPSLHARVGLLRRRAKILVEQGLLTGDEATKMLADTGVPPLTKPDEQTADTLDVWEGFIATVELGLSTYGRTEDYLRRLRALPVDLLAHAETAAKELEPPVPNLTTGKVTGPDLDRLEAVLAPIELLHAERFATVTQHLSGVDEWEAIVGWATEQRDEPTISIADLNNLEAERVIALCATYRVDDLEAAIRNIGTAAQAKAIAKTVTDRHQIPMPTSARAIASDRVLAGLVLTHNTESN